MDRTHSPSRLENYLFTVTQDWFSFNIENWKALLPLIKSSYPRVLEIGSWEGRSAVWLLKNVCRKGGELVCVDHFDLSQTEAGRERYARVKHNLSVTAKPFRILDEFSIPGLMKLLEEEITSRDGGEGFDWIYVDGSHRADDTFLDGELVWRMAREGAIVIFDDYHWDKEPDYSIHHPKRGIDAFMNLHEGEYNILSSPAQYQVVLQKISAMRIGFLVKAAGKDTSHDAFDYGINLVLAVDTVFAMPAAVAIRSAIENTPGRITIYVINCGLSDNDIQKIVESKPLRSDVTIQFLSLPSNSLAEEMGPSWAKIDLVRLLPVERAIYLDADVLVRGDLRELWKADLVGVELGAVTDVGHPMGHEMIAKAPYFNAGVLLLDLAKSRLKVAELEATGRRMKDSRYKDQDALNAHFSGHWLKLDLKWNAQGLGTYATKSWPDRDVLGMEEMAKAPHIVHFTGPVHPPLAAILDPYNQPYAAKPWGYAGAPGNPYTVEWWVMLEKTAWQGMRKDEGWIKTCAKEKEKSIETGLRLLEARLETSPNVD